jgi:cell division protein FtsL
MQQNKGVKQIGVLKEVVSNIEKLTDSLSDVVGRVRLRSYFAPFDGLKSKGYSISSLLACIVIMPYEGVASPYALMKHGITGRDLQSKKDAFYSAKNNENIDWRHLLMQVAKRFTHLVVKDIGTSKRRITALIFDDSLLEKTGNRIEKISVTYDHVSNRFLLVFKLLVCGWWDGASFIPLDFSLHREKGKKQEELATQYIRSIKLTRATRLLVARLTEALTQKQGTNYRHMRISWLIQRLNLKPGGN